MEVATDYGKSLAEHIAKLKQLKRDIHFYSTKLKFLKNLQNLKI